MTKLKLPMLFYYGHKKLRYLVHITLYLTNYRSNDNKKNVFTTKEQIFKKLVVEN